MKTSTRLFTCMLIGFLVLLTGQAVMAQSILNPNDSVITYNPNNPPAIPAYGTIAKWVRTVRMSWNTSNWKCYIYNGCQFRLRFPKSYQPGVNDGKLYPMMIFDHGEGEQGTVYDNEYSLYHGGNVFEAAVSAGTFDGYVLVMQTGGGWGINQFNAQHDIINYMIANNKLDPFRVMFNGLSGGGQGTWQFYQTYPTYIAGILPMSAVAIAYASPDSVAKYKFTRIWNIHGGLDGSPAPYTAQQVLQAMQAQGANYIDLDMTTQGHDTWDSTWSMPAFWPWMLAQYASNPWCLFGRTQFCQGDTINLTVGLTPGYQGYQWRKNGVIIPGANTNTINVTSIGTYDAQVERNGTWSNWSPQPVVVSYATTTVTPAITTNGLLSKVIPAPDGNTGVSLFEPAGYATYTWQQVGNNNTLGAANTYYANTPGQYTCQVTQQFGCSSNPSAPFTVINANGPNKPDPASGVVASTLSPTSLLLTWSQDPNPAHNETGFEIYQGTHTGGPYKLVAITAQDASIDTVRGLSAGTKYYYIIRAVDSTGASANSNEASGTTTADTQPPTTPGNLAITGSSRTSITLSWTASTDNVAVAGYYVYIDGARSYIVAPNQTSFTVGNLNYGQSYEFYITAYDSAGNLSPASGQVSGEPLINGLTYQYFTFATSPSALPNYSTMTPVSTGTVANVTLSPATQTTNFGFLFQGYLHVTTAGNYTFQTSSDDGSAMYLGTLNSTSSAYTFGSKPLVNNDGAHGTTTVTSAAVNLSAGIYPIAIAYFQAGGGDALTMQWKVPGTGSYVAIPNSALADAPVVNGQAPAAPSNVIATSLSYNQISVTWTDNSNNEANFEIWRSTSPTSGFANVGTVGAGVTGYIDSTVSAKTRYYYEVRADNLYGESPFATNYTEAEWKFDNNYTDSTGNGYTLTAAGTPTFDATNKVEGGWSLKLSGSNQGVTIPNTGSFLLTGYNQLTVAGWVKANTTGSNRVIFDIGGSDNGLALLLNNSTLTAAVASANVRANITTTITATSWNHVAVVYKGDSLLLYVNGVLAASNTSLTFHTLANTTNGSRFGETNGSNAFNNNGSAFNGWIDDFGVYSMAFTPDVIQALMGFKYAQSNAITGALPPAPSAPGHLTATAASSSSINLAWTDSAANASNVQVWRSANNNQQFVLWATLPASAASFTDTGLFSNATYYYEVRAINIGGNSAFTAQASATTKDNLPVITRLPLNEQARYGTTTVFNVSATSVNSGTLAFTGGNLPSFATLTDNGNRTATLTMTPAIGNAGNYPGLYIVVADAFGGTDTTKFNLAVNNNYAPTLDSISNYTMNEGDTLTIPLAGVNSNNPSDTLSFAVTNAPGGSVLTNVSNGSASLFLHPNYSSAGTYNVQVTLNDNNGLSATQTFAVTVKVKNPNTKIFSRVVYNDAGALGAPWNGLLGTTTNNLVDSNGNTTTLGLSFNPNNWWTPFNGGSSTGNNSGVYPDPVLTDYIWFGSIYGGPNVFNGTVTGADTASSYDLTFFANSVYNGVPNNGSTTYSAGSDTVTLSVQNNTQNTVTIPNLKPNPDGTINFSMGLGPNTVLGYFNALVITKHYDDGSAPAGISGLTAQNAPSQVQLNWTDSAYNATGYEVWRALRTAGSYSLLGTVQGNSGNSYVDSTVSGNTGYTYRVRAVNTHGASPFDSVSTVTMNRLPKINPVSNIILADTSSMTVGVTTVDDSTAQLTLTATNLPPFASFADNGNGTGTLTITPSAGTVGMYQNITITATDALDSTASTTFSIAITEPNVRSVYVSFTGGASCPAPWNVLQTPPFQGSVLSNLTDDSGTPTGISATIVDGWYWYGVTGNANGNQAGNLPTQLVYPPSVVQNFFYDPSSAQRRIQFSGLDNSKQYNFVFFNSQWDGTNGLTTFTINGDSVQLQADWNVNQTVQLNGIRPVNGAVTVIVTKAAAAANAYLNSIVLQGYDTTAGNLLSPADLRALNITQTTVSLQWQDRSAIEAGYEVWRATDNTGSYSLLASLPANATTYLDKGLTKGANYYYIVRTKGNGGNFSNYSSPLAVTTYTDAIYIHPSTTSAGDGPTPPWNNLNSPGGTGTSWSNFIDSTGAVTSIGMVQTGDFAGANQLGDVTGNNSGVYPDPVLYQQYVLFPGNFGSFTISGLNLSKVYDFTFFGSENYEGMDNNTGYVVNGDTVYLNALDNTNAIVTLHGIVPNAMGQANIVMWCPGASLAGWFNAMVIQGYTPVPRNAPNVPQTTGGAISPLRTGIAQMPVVPQQITMDTVVRAYPNPFHTSFTLSVPVTNADEKVMVTLYDASGRLVYRKEFDNVLEGMNYLQVGDDAHIGGPGVYMGKVVFSSGRAPQTIKLLKN